MVNIDLSDITSHLKDFGYELVYKSKKSNARVGRIHTPHGIVNTPGFVSVATNGALKAVDHLAAGRNMYMKM